MRAELCTVSTGCWGQGKDHVKGAASRAESSEMTATKDVFLRE